MQLGETKGHIIKVLVYTHGRVEQLLKSLLHVLAAFGPHQEVYVLDARARPEQLLDEHFAHETGAAGDKDGSIAVEVPHGDVADVAARGHSAGVGHVERRRWAASRSSAGAAGVRLRAGRCCCAALGPLVRPTYPCVFLELALLFSCRTILAKCSRLRWSADDAAVAPEFGMCFNQNRCNPPLRPPSSRKLYFSVAAAAFVDVVDVVLFVFVAKQLPRSLRYTSLPVSVSCLKKTTLFGYYIVCILTKRCSLLQIFFQD